MFEVLFLIDLFSYLCSLNLLSWKSHTMHATSQKCIANVIYGYL